MKQGWEIKKLKECCRFVGGYTPSPSLLHTEGYTPYFKVSDMNRDGNSRELYNTELYLKEAKKTYPAGAIVFPKNGGAVLTNKKRILVTNSVVDLNTGVAIPNSDVNVDYLYYFFCGVDFCNFVKEGTLPVLKIKEIGELPIFLPPLAEQKRIVEILDREFEKIDALKANVERSLQQVKDLFQAALKQELQPKEGWETKRLSDICVITSSKRIFKSEYVAEGIPFYRTKEVKEIANNLPISVELYISNEKYYEIKNKFGVPHINDLLVSAVGTIGEIMVVTDDKPFYFKDGNLVWLKGIQGVHSWYLKYYLKSIIDDIKNMTRGAAYNALTIEKFQTMDICFSSMAEQKQIVMRLDKLSTLCKALEENYTKTMALCDDMKQALLRQAFNGEL